MRRFPDPDDLKGLSGTGDHSEISNEERSRFPKDLASHK